MTSPSWLPQASDKPAGGAAAAGGGGPIADLFTKIEGFLSEDIVKSTQAVYQFEVTGMCGGAGLGVGAGGDDRDLSGCVTLRVFVGLGTGRGQCE